MFAAVARAISRNAQRRCEYNRLFAATKVPGQIPALYRQIPQLQPVFPQESQGKDPKDRPGLRRVIDLFPASGHLLPDGFARLLPVWITHIAVDFPLAAYYHSFSISDRLDWIPAAISGLFME